MKPTQNISLNTQPPAVFKERRKNVVQIWRFVILAHQTAPYSTLWLETFHFVW